MCCIYLCFKSKYCYNFTVLQLLATDGNNEESTTWLVNITFSDVYEKWLMSKINTLLVGSQSVTRNKTLLSNLVWGLNVSQYTDDYTYIIYIKETLLLAVLKIKLGKSIRKVDKRYDIAKSFCFFAFSHTPRLSRRGVGLVSS